jgi:hypothetical protein
VGSNPTPSVCLVERAQEAKSITVSHNKSADFQRSSILLFTSRSDKETGDEERIHVDGAVGETTSLR